MLPDFPNIKRKVGSLLRSHVKEEIFRRSPILKEIHRAVQHEGCGGTYKEVDGKENLIEYEKIATELSMTRDEMRCGSFQTIVSKFDEIAETFAEAQSKILFATVSEAAESVGNVVDAKGKQTKEAFLEMVGKVEWGFDPQTGEPRRPTLVVHPETLEKIKDDVEKWKQDPVFLVAMSEIEQRQRLACRDRESRRRLAD